MHYDLELLLYGRVSAGVGAPSTIFDLLWYIVSSFNIMSLQPETIMPAALSCSLTLSSGYFGMFDAHEERGMNGSLENTSMDQETGMHVMERILSFPRHTNT